MCKQYKKYYCEKKIKTKDIKWAYIKSDEWVISKKSYAKAKLLLTKEWVCDNVPMFAKNNKVKYEIRTSS
jgi:hypothetical protein